MRVDALDERGLLRIPRERVAVLTGDANRRIGEILRRFNKKDYILVFADPENPSQWPWASVEALRAQGHESIDLYSLLPLEMGIRRLLNFKGRERTKYGQRITAFFGCEDWRPIVEARTTESQSAEMLRQLEDLYLGRLRTLWRYADRALEVRRIGEQGLYRMIFASNHDAGRRIALWARRRAREQKELRLGDW
jgi:three-Cys-motif partner protein